MSSFLRHSDTVEEQSDFGKHVPFGRQDLFAVSQSNSSTVHQAISLIDGVDDFLAKIISSQSDNVDAARSSGAAVGEHEGSNILKHASRGSNERIAADGSEVNDRH